MSQALVKKVMVEKLPAMREWKNTDDLLRGIHHTLSRFRQGFLDCEQARIEVRGFQCAAAILALQLEHAKITERIKRGDTSLPGFNISE